MQASTVGGSGLVVVLSLSSVPEEVIGRFVTNHICPRRYVTKRSDMYQHYKLWTICHNFFSTWTICHFYFGRFVTSHICHNFILDDVSQVIFVLDNMSQKKNSDLGWYVGRYGRFATIVFHTGRVVMNFREVTFGMHAC